jgi:cytochrome c oxidase accessory protein FixG
MSNLSTDKEHYRDAVSTIDKEGKRVWIYPRKPKGWYFNVRKLVSYGLLTLLFAGPFLKVNGLPMLMLNFPERKFILFGTIFWPQDFFILALAFLTFIIFIILFTVIYGRVFCGWVCPQTIFMEMVFRRIEYFIEGDFAKQKALTQAPWSREKILKRGAKHGIFFFISFLIANTFLAYIIGVEALQTIMTDSPAEHLSGLLAIVLFTGVFYWIFASFREQVCTIVCPYGRLQGVMLDKKSLVVAYDYIRGEPRAKLRRNAVRSEGDCIDCHQCVQVCPTGIDIRNGTQLECINCTACIDACDAIMDLVEKPRGLIRYDSEEGIAQKAPWKLTPRVIGYSLVLLVLSGVLVLLMVTRSNVEATVLRTPGMLYQTAEDGRITNLYNISVINKTDREMPLTLRLLSPEGELTMVKGDIVLPRQGKSEGVFFARISRDQLPGTSSKIIVGIFHGEEMVDKRETKFLGPAK